LLNLIFFTALLSINLGVLNLLPIPILDGGHLTFFCIELFRGRPVSVKKREIAQRVGLVLLVALMIFAFYNDIFRLLARP
jgi:regulator of sigma E protease